MSFREISPSEIGGNVIDMIGREWMLVTAAKDGAREGDVCGSTYNTMTASWGGIGVLWNKNVSFVFIRDSRYTLEFVDGNDYYSLSFFGGSHQKELLYCGRNSGRDVDKMKETGLEPVFGDKAPGFAQAEIVLVCRKLYRQSMTAESFLDKELIDKFYADSDWHEIFVGEICEVWTKP